MKRYLLTNDRIVILCDFCADAVLNYGIDLIVLDKQRIPRFIVLTCDGEDFGIPHCDDRKLPFRWIEEGETNDR